MENSAGQLQPSQGGAVVVVVVVRVVVSVNSTLDELDKELVDTGSTADFLLSELDTDKATDSVLEDDGATVTFTGSLKLDDENTEQAIDDEELDDTVALKIKFTMGTSENGSVNSTSFFTIALVEDSKVSSMSILTSCPPRNEHNDW